MPWILPETQVLSETAMLCQSDTTSSPKCLKIGSVDAMKRALVGALLAMVSSSGFCQTPLSNDELLNRARKGDVSAILQLGNQGGAPELVAMRNLLGELKDEPYLTPYLRRALAKLGHRDSLQYVACDCLTGNVHEMPELIKDDLDYVGGQFAIAVYRRLLDSDNHFQPQIDDAMKQGGDSWPALPSHLVLVKLHTLMPSAPIPETTVLDEQAHPERIEGLKSTWRSWIDDHQPELSKLKPTAEGIRLDPKFCSRETTPLVLPR